MESKLEEIHVWLDLDQWDPAHGKLYTTFKDTMFAIGSGANKIIHTTQTAALNFNFAENLFIHNRDDGVRLVYSGLDESKKYNYANFMNSHADMMLWNSFTSTDHAYQMLIDILNSELYNADKRIEELNEE